MPRYGPIAFGLMTVTAATGANSWGFFLKSSELTCERYNDLVFLNSQRGSIAYSGGDTKEGPVTMIPIDSEGLVGDGSFCFKAGAGSVATSIFVWDVLGAVLHEHALTAGDRATTPVYVSGYLYWLEWQITFVNPCTVSLMRSRCDLGDVTEIETFSLPEANGNAGGAVVGLIVPTSTALVFSWKTGNEDTHAQLRFYAKQFSAGSPTDVSAAWASHYGVRESIDAGTWYDGEVDGAALYDTTEALSYLTQSVTTNHDSGFDGGSRGRLQTLVNSSSTPGIIWPNFADPWVIFPDEAAALSVGGDFAQVSNAAGIFLRHDRSLPIEAGDPLLSGEVEGDGDEVFPTCLFYVGASA